MKESTYSGQSGWKITLGVVLLAQMLTAVGFSMIFPFLPLYVESLGSSTGISVELMAGLVYAAQGFTMMIASPLWGAVADRYGRKLMVLRAMFGGTVILALMGLVTSGEQLVLLRAVQGLVTGTVAANNALVASVVPRHRIGVSMGALQVGLWAGVAMGPLLGGAFADAYGYANAFFITAGALFIGGVLVYFGVNEKFTPAQSAEKAKRPGMLEQWRHVIAADGISLVFLLRFLAGTGRTMIVPIAPLFVAALLPAGAGNQNFIAGAVTAAASLTSTISGVALGYMGDRIGHRRVLIWCAVASVALYIPQSFVNEVWQLILLQGMVGFALGGLVSAPSALMAQYTEPGEEGAVYGLDNSVVAGSRAVAPLVGSSVALAFGLRGTFAATAILFVFVTIIAYSFLPKPKVAPGYPAAVSSGD